MHHAMVGAVDLVNSDTVCDVTCDYGFARDNRLLETNQFQAVFNQTDCKAVDNCFVVLAKRRSDGVARLGMAISKRRVRHAVDRNRIKRLVRDSFRHNKLLLAGLDIVVMERQGTAERDNTELSKALNQLWLRLAKRCKSC